MKYLLQGPQIENLKLRLNFSRSYGLLPMFVVKIGELLNKIKKFNLIYYSWYWQSGAVFKNPLGWPFFFFFFLIFALYYTFADTQLYGDFRLILKWLGKKKLKPASDAVLEISRIEFNKSNSCEVRRLNQLGMANWIGSASCLVSRE